MQTLKSNEDINYNSRKTRTYLYNDTDKADFHRLNFYV